MTDFSLEKCLHSVQELRGLARAGVSSDEEEEATWPVKRPRGYNPAIERRDLQSMAAAAAAIASARPPEPGTSKGPRTSCYRSAN